jgi:hypothetical protein
MGLYQFSICQVAARSPTGSRRYVSVVATVHEHPLLSCAAASSASALVGNHVVGSASTSSKLRGSPVGLPAAAIWMIVMMPPTEARSSPPGCRAPPGNATNTGMTLDAMTDCVPRDGARSGGDSIGTIEIWSTEANRVGEGVSDAATQPLAVSAALSVRAKTDTRAQLIAQREFIFWRRYDSSMVVSRASDVTERSCSDTSCRPATSSRMSHLR